MRIAIAQCTSGRDLTANLDLVGSQVAAAAASGANLVIFPEAMMRAFGNRLTDIAEPVDGPWASQVADFARTAGVVVVAGMFTPGRPNADGAPRVRNTLLVTGVDTDGREVAHHYDKVHLFDAFGFRESETVEPGSTRVMITVGGVRLGLSTCFDVRFPEHFRQLAREGADAIVVCASWQPGPGKPEQWDLLIRARALDATSWVLAAGQADPRLSNVDTRPGAPTGVGHSAVVSPRGEVIQALGAGPGMLWHDLDIADLADIRAEIPVL